MSHDYRYADWDGVKHFAKDLLNGLVLRNARKMTR